MTDTPSGFDELRRIADELELKAHLASMDARERWQELKPRLVELEKTILHGSEHASKVVTDELSSIGKALRQLRDEIARAAESRGTDARR